MRVMNSVFRIENDILLLNTYFNSQMYKKYRNSLELNPTIKAFTHSTLKCILKTNYIKIDTFTLLETTKAQEKNRTYASHPQNLGEV